MSRLPGSVSGLILTFGLAGSFGLTVAPASATTPAPAGTQLVDEVPAGSGFQSFDSRAGYAVWQTISHADRSKNTLVVRTPDGQLIRRTLRVRRHEIANGTSIDRRHVSRERVNGAARLVTQTGVCSTTTHRCRTLFRDLLTGAEAAVDTPKVAQTAFSAIDGDSLVQMTPPKPWTGSPSPTPACSATTRSLATRVIRALPPLASCSSVSDVDVSGSVIVARVDRFAPDGTRDGSQDVAIDTAAAAPAWVQLHRSVLGDGTAPLQILATPTVTPAPSFIGVEAQMIFPVHGHSREVAPRTVLRWDLSAVAAAGATPVVDSGLPALAATTVPISPELAAHVAEVGQSGTQLLAVSQRRTKDARGRARIVTQILALPDPV
jgi:hypothetical protein